MSGAIYVLIMVFGGYSSQSGLTSFTQEFTSMERCETTRSSITAQAPKSGTSQVQVSGCYKK